jgi:hypothetical protein
MSVPSGRVFVMDEFEDVVDRVRAWALTAADARGVQLPDRASTHQIVDAEALLGYGLHPLLKRLYLEIANGGFGPGRWRLMSVEQLTMWRRVDVPAGQSCGWPDRVVAVMDVGCAMLSVVDCGDPGGQVLLMDPNAFDTGQPEAWSLDAATLAQWLEKWLDGSSWLIEQDAEIEEIEWPVPWPDAVAWLAAVEPSSRG